jgi:molybdopterin/thiamine biosynthesis adenylyltransferase
VKTLEATKNFDYKLAFSRNLGWITPSEQLKLKGSRIAIAGMGGVGGVHLLTLVRLGISNFHIADFDEFEIQNFNRQVGADMSTLGQPKVEVLKSRAIGINPELNIKTFNQGVNEGNLNEFLDGVDIYVDGLDIFVLELRELLFQACADRGIPVIVVGPIGMGTALVSFVSGGMSFEEYFGFKGRSPFEKYCRFILGLAPKFLHLKSLVDRSYANAHQQKAPSLPMGCELAAGVMGTEVLKHILKRGPRLSAPWSFQFDAATY